MDADVAIIGGGPGGAIAGARLAEAGISCLVLEKDHFPRFHIGESLLPAGNELLRSVGVFEKIEQAGFIVKKGARFCDPHYRHVKRISFDTALAPVDPYTYQVERAKYDGLLLDHARERGCRVEHGVQVERFEEGTDEVRIYRKGMAHPLRVRWMLDATGRDCLSVRQSGAKKQALKRFRKRIAIYTHLAGVKIAPGDEGGDTVAVRFEDGWVWIIPLDEKRTSVGLVLDVSSFPKGRDPADVYWSKLRSAPYLADVLEKAEALDPMRVTADYSYFYKSPIASPRVLPLGDAFGFLDPIFSSGVYMAESSGYDAANLVIAHAATGAPFSQRERIRYERRLRRRATAFRHIVEAFYDADGFKVFLDPGELWRIADAVTNIVAGDTSCPFNVRWRYRLFLLICRLQKHIPIVATARSADLSVPDPVT